MRSIFLKDGPMELRNLISFIRAAELQSFSKTAEQLGYSQSAVTMQLKQLEEELGIPLFERIGKRVKLTQAEERFLPRALEVLEAVGRAQQVAQEPERPGGRLRASAPASPWSAACCPR